LNENTPAEDREVVLRLLKFIATGITVTAAIIGIASAIGKARSLEPTYVYTIPVTLMSPQPGFEPIPVPEPSTNQENQGIQYAH